jgi:catechol 2,3-dioxygenase-like lactoylglutathione lyase family enzyme
MMNILESTLHTDKLAETAYFYSTVLQFEVMEKSGMSVSFRIGSSRLRFEQTDNVKDPKYHFAFTIPVNRVEEAVTWMLERVTLIKTETDNPVAHFKNWNAQAIYFYDNNYNIVELIARADVKIPSEKAFSAESIFSINEVGIVTEAPLKLGAELRNNTPIAFFSKGPKREDFLAMGDDNGLLIIARKNRNWYPTTDKAEKQKVKVKVAIDTYDLELIFN